MKQNMRRNLPGAFLAGDLGGGAWRLSRSELPPLEVRLRAADPHAADVLRAGHVQDVAVEWRPDSAVLHLTSQGRQMTLQMRSAIVHEPLVRLYDALPLADFDSKARRFWRRVFRLVRIPGGRHLLGILARRGRGRS
jgi:hypothetical protein